jgi:hypothetical protein
MQNVIFEPVSIPVVERSKARVCSRSPAGIAGSNPARGEAWISVSCECLCCQVEVSASGQSLVQWSPADCDVLLSVIYKPKEWGVLGPRWAVAPERKNNLI